MFRRVFLLEQNLKIVAYASVGRIMTHKGGRCVFWVILGNFDFHIIGRHEFSLAPIKAIPSINPYINENRAVLYIDPERASW